MSIRFIRAFLYFVYKHLSARERRIFNIVVSRRHGDNFHNLT